MFLSQNTLAAHPEARHALLQPSPQRLQLESPPSEPWTLAKTPPPIRMHQAATALEAASAAATCPVFTQRLGWHNSVETGQPR